MSRLKDRLAIVTGGARGLGGGTADVLSAEGAFVVIADILDEAGEARVASLRQRGLKAEYQRLDVRDAGAWNALIELVMQKHQRLDVLVNNAGINISATIEDVTAQQFRDLLEVNLIGAFLGMQAAIPAMRKSGGGSIINIASNSTQMVLPLTSVYGASKSALANLTKTTAVHCAQQGYNIRVNSVHPGAHETDMLSAENAAKIPQVKALIDAIPMGRMGQANELGKVVAFLASDDSSYMTASELFSDGGLTVVSFGGDPALRQA